jgi:hypothetical protein
VVVPAKTFLSQLWQPLGEEGFARSLSNWRTVCC